MASLPFPAFKKWVVAVHEVQILPELQAIQLSEHYSHTRVSGLGPKEGPVKALQAASLIQPLSFRNVLALQEIQEVSVPLHWLQDPVLQPATVQACSWIAINYWVVKLTV